MLKLTRNIGQSLFIGENIKIIFLGLYGKQIRVGIEAPKEINVVREEIKDKPRKDKEVKND